MNASDIGRQDRRLLVPERSAFDSEGSDKMRIGIGHLYATGGNFARDAIFHIGGVVFTEDIAPAYQDWIINPGRPITLRLYKKSQVTNEDAESSPPWRDHATSIQAFFADLDVLFVFDLHREREWFTRHVLRGSSRKPAVIDLHKMARFFLPDRTFYDQEELIGQAVPQSEWKRSDPRLLYFLRALSKILQGVLDSITTPFFGDDNRAAVLSLLTHALKPSGPADFDWMRRIAGKESIRWTDEFPRVRASHRIPEEAPSVAEVGSWIKSKLPKVASEHYIHSSDGQKTLDHRTLSETDIETAFDHLASLEDVVRRPRQIEYAKFIGSAINSGGRFAIEAGTGTGKTLGYLVPAAEFLLKHPNKKVVVATATKNLQSQILGRELEKVTTRRSKYQDLRYALIKGKSNYICLSALIGQYDKLFLGDQRDKSADRRLAWLHLAILCARTNGDLETAAISDKAFLDLRDEVNSGEHCTPELCDERSHCIYPRLLAQANGAQIIVTNHHRLATLGEEFVASAALCIIDEADQFPDNFRSALQTELTWRDVDFRFVRRLRTASKNRRGFAQLARDYFHKQLQEAPGNRELERGAASCQQVIAACDQIIESARLIHKVAPNSGEWEMRWQNLAPEEIGSLMRSLQDIFDAIEGVVDGLKALEQLADSNGFLKKRKAQVLRYINLAEEIRNRIQTLCSGFDTNEYVHVIAPGWTLKRVPMQIWHALEQIILKSVPTSIFTSATLYVKQSLQLFKDELSMVGEFTRDCRIESPFAYSKKVLGFVATSLPQFDARAFPKERKAWQVSIANAIVQLVVPVYGRSLILFTNRAEMEAVFQHAKPLLEDGDVEVLIQQGTSLLEISTFRSVEHSTLCGVDRFWTGVDFPGPTLSQVIIARSPNPNLGNPLIEHRLEYYGTRFWDRFYHPVARLKMRQGFGRLIRDEKDRGVFVFLDSRAVNDGPVSDMESELPISLEPAPDIGTAAGSPIKTVQRVLAHLRLATEYDARK